MAADTTASDGRSVFRRRTRRTAHDPYEFAAACHPACVACRSRGAGGLGLRFEGDAEGVRAEFACDTTYQGYPDRVHGGVIATLLDAAMTHCLFARQVRGYTVRLNIRFHAPLQLGPPAVVRAAVTGARPPLYLLRAEVRQADHRCASAEASFFGERNPDPSRDAH